MATLLMYIRDSETTRKLLFSYRGPSSNACNRVDSTKGTKVPGDSKRSNKHKSTTKDMYSCCGRLLYSYQIPKLSYKSLIKQCYIRHLFKFCGHARSLVILCELMAKMVLVITYGHFIQKISAINLL